MKMPRSTRRSTSGFTLIELLVVIIILAILAAVVVPRVLHRTEDAKDSAARSDIANIAQQLEIYKADTGTYPSEEEGLQALVANASQNPKWNGPYIKGGVPTDPWGKGYVYKNPGAHGTDPDVFTTDSNGAQIGSWDLKK